MKQTDPVPPHPALLPPSLTPNLPRSSKPGRKDRPCPNRHMNTSTYISEERATNYTGTAPSSGEKGFSEGKRLGWVLTAGVNLVTGQEGALESRDLQVPARLYNGRWGLGQVTSAPSSPAHSVITKPPSLSCSATKMQLHKLKALWSQEVSVKLRLATGMIVPSSTFLRHLHHSWWFHFVSAPGLGEGPCLKNPGAWVISNT